LFALMQELAEGGYPTVPSGIGFAVAKEPARLVPLAEAMANRFLELSNIRPSQADGQAYLNRYEGLVRALLALPDNAFAKVAAPLNAYFVEQVDNRWGRRFPELQARAKRASAPVTPAFHEADFMTARGYRQLFPALAICRIGKADPAVISEMKARLL